MPRPAARLRRLARWLRDLLTATAPALAVSPSVASDPGVVAWQAVLPHVWVWPGAIADPAPDNQGQVGASVVWVTDGEATLWDPGPSRRHAQRLIDEVQARFGARITRVLNSHAHAEHVLGNSAFAPTQVWATTATQTAMAQRCPQCLAHLQHLLGAAALSGTETVLPGQTLASGTLQAGGYQWQVSEMRDAHSESDLVLWQPDTRVLLAGGLVYRQRLPELAQGSALGWLAALQRLAAWQPQQVVGLAVVGDASDIEATRGYLCALVGQVWQAMERGQLASQTALPLPQYAGWAGYAQRHAFNVQRVWRELEPWWIEQRPLPNYCQTSGGN